MEIARYLGASGYFFLTRKVKRNKEKKSILLANSQDILTMKDFLHGVSSQFLKS